MRLREKENIMKNVQVVDDAINCVYDVFSISEEDFNLIFPGNMQNIEFIEDLHSRLGDEKLASLQKRIFQKRVKKSLVNGIHGTLFYQMEYKREFYPNKIDEAN